MEDVNESGAAVAVAVDVDEGETSTMPVEDVAAQVKQCKLVLDGKDNPAEELLAALMALRKMGTLPTKLLSETLIGKTVNTIAKAAADDAVRTKAKELVEEWRSVHRKRKAATEGGGNPPLKRGASSCASISSEAPAKGLPASQEKASVVDDDAPLQPPSEAQPRAQVQRTDSLLSTQEDSSQPFEDTEVPPYRGKVRQKLLEALGKAEEIETKDGSGAGGEEEMRDPVKLADEIDQELNGAFPKKEEYMMQARSILFNLKDKKNQSFKFKLMMGFYNPADVPKLTADDMASDEKNEWRAKQRNYSMLEIQSDWDIKNGGQRFTGMFTCGKCKGTKTTYFQMQTRSSDEPMTTFVSCVTCNNRWKFC